MRQTFDRKVPLAEQRIRVALAKQPGRKHQHRPSAKVKEARKATARRRVQLFNARLKKYKEQVRAYWRGDSTEYPKPMKAVR